MRSFDEAPLCETCHAAKQSRPAAPQPVFLTVVFAVSFLAMLLVTQDRRLPPIILWSWSGIQFILGVLLIAARNRAKKLIFRCLRCESPLP